VAATRLLVQKPNRDSDVRAIGVNMSTDVLIEESEVYSFDFVGIGVGVSSGVRVRRCYANARGTHGTQKNGPTLAFREDSAPGVIFENDVDESPSPNAGASFFFVGGSDPAKALGDMSITDQTFYVGSPQVSLENVVGLKLTDAGFAYALSTQSTTSIGLAGATFIGDRTALFDSPNSPPMGTLTITDLVAIGSFSYSLGLSGVASWTSDYIDLPASALYGLDAGNVPHVTTDVPNDIGPGNGHCLVYVPAESNMKGRGADGGDIGANVIYRYQDGIPTSEKLWSPSGRFPCGAIVTGVNDVAGASCFDVNERLGVGVHGCPVP
jgi:hypothetical protein